MQQLTARDVRGVGTKLRIAPGLLDPVVGLGVQQMEMHPAIVPGGLEQGDGASDERQAEVTLPNGFRHPIAPLLWHERCIHQIVFTDIRTFRLSRFPRC